MVTLVTGGTGFVGANIVRDLARNGDGWGHGRAEQQHGEHFCPGASSQSQGGPEPVEEHGLPGPHAAFAGAVVMLISQVE